MGRRSYPGKTVFGSYIINITTGYGLSDSQTQSSQELKQGKGGAGLLFLLVTY